MEDVLARGDRRSILEHLLTERGLGYADLPKALLKFHRYPDGPRAGGTPALRAPVSALVQRGASPSRHTLSGLKPKVTASP